MKIIQDNDIINLNRKRKLFSKKFHVFDTYPNVWFITLTLNSKYGKIREDKTTIKNALKNCLRNFKKATYLAVYETHQKGGWHSHLITDTMTMITILKNYHSGFV